MHKKQETAIQNAGAPTNFLKFPKIRYKLTNNSTNKGHLIS